MTYTELQRMRKQADAFYDTVDDSDVKSKYPLSKEDKAQLLAAILRDYEEAQKYKILPKGRKLYLAGVTRYDDVPVNEAEIYPDIRDKNDPKFRYADAVKHWVSWYPGDDRLMWNG